MLGGLAQAVILFRLLAKCPHPVPVIAGGYSFSIELNPIADNMDMLTVGVVVADHYILLKAVLRGDTVSEVSPLVSGERFALGQ